MFQLNLICTENFHKNIYMNYNIKHLVNMTQNSKSSKAKTFGESITLDNETSSYIKQNFRRIEVKYGNLCKHI